MNGKYRPLTEFYLETNEYGQEVLVGKIELPISVGSKGGSIETNPASSNAHYILGYPTAQEISMIMVSVGLA
jgi:hydroxymethylglutaryl-CoA reductase